MGSIREDVQTSAQWISAALSASGYRADFSPDSLHEIDRFFAENSHDGQPTGNGLLAESLGERLFGIGSYVGEVLRRNLGGEWHGDDADPRAEINVALWLADGKRCWPVQRAMKRYRSGFKESLAVYGAGLGLHYTRSIWPGDPALPPSPAAPRESAAPAAAKAQRPWWRFWR